MSTASKGGLMASVDSSRSFFPKSHTQMWDMLLSRMFTEACVLLMAQREQESGSCPSLLAQEWEGGRVGQCAML